MQLATYLEEKGQKPADFAARISARGVPVSIYGVRKWLYGYRLPRAAALQAILVETDGAVTPQDFVSKHQSNAA